MSFLNPALLAFTAAIAVPILIHLLNRRRFRRVSWAAMRFLRVSIEKNRRRMQWEDLILLALRCLTVALLAVALARPAWRAAATFLDAGGAAAVVVLDQSASLSASDGTRTRMELARAAAEAAVDSYPAGSAVAVLFGGDRVEEALPEPTLDLNLARKTLREAPQADVSSDHSTGIARAVEILATQRALRKEIVLVTDRQALGWRRFPEIVSAMDKAGDTRLRVVFVGGPVEDNLAVAGLTRAEGFASAREPLRFQAEIVNRGAAPIQQARATLHINDGPAVDQAVFDVLAPGESRRATFFAKLNTPGPHAVSVRLPPDRMTADDERTLAVRAVDVVRVLIVEGDPEAKGAFFLRHALQPVPEEQRAGYYLQPRVIPAAQLALTRLNDFDAVVLSDVPTLSRPAVDALRDYARGGGAVLVFAGPRANASFYNTELLENAGLLPASLGRVLGEPGSDETALTIADGPYQHPVFALWNEAGSGSLRRARFFAAWELEPAPGSGSGETGAEGEGDPPGVVALRYSNGAPAIVERSTGRGRVMLVGTTAGTEWNDLAVRPAFVPTLHRSLAYLAGARETRQNVRAGAPVTLRLPSEAAGGDAVIFAPGTPERRLTRVVRGGPEGAVLAFDDTRQAGAYRISLAGSGSSEPLAILAAQMDPAESDLTEISPEDRLELERVAQVVEWAPGTNLREVFERARVGVELWMPLLLAVIALVLLETWLAQHFSRTR